MTIALLLARLLLALVFGVAGLAKLADLDGSRQALRDFGVPTWLANPSGIVLPLGELAVGVALLFTLTAWWGAIGTAALLLSFVAGISYNLARGRTPDCHCFGQLHSAPAGPSTLARNLTLTLVAGFVIVFGRSNAGLDLWSGFGQLSPDLRLGLIGGGVVLVLLVGILWLLWHVVRQQGELLLRLEGVEARLSEMGLPSQAVHTKAAGLAVGTPAPFFQLSTTQRETVTLESLREAGLPVLLLFATPGCAPCAALFPEVGRWQRDYASKLTLAVISRGTSQANQQHMSPHGITRVLLQKHQEVATAYRTSGTPTGVLVRPDGTIGSPLAQGAEAIRALVETAVKPPALRSLPMVAAPGGGNGNRAEAPRKLPTQRLLGDPAPEFSLPDLSGQIIRLSDFRGSTTLLLFWRPGCGFCQRMLAALKAWEAQVREGTPRLLVISSESVEANRAMGLRSPVLLDASGMSIGSQFGAYGTPMAVLLDAQSRIASEVVAGEKAVLALAGAPAVSL